MFILILLYFYILNTLECIQYIIIQDKIDNNTCIITPKSSHFLKNSFISISIICPNDAIPIIYPPLPSFLKYNSSSKMIEGIAEETKEMKIHYVISQGCIFPSKFSYIIYESDSCRSLYNNYIDSNSNGFSFNLTVFTINIIR